MKSLRNFLRPDFSKSGSSLHQDARADQLVGAVALPPASATHRPPARPDEATARVTARPAAEDDAQLRPRVIRPGRITMEGVLYIIFVALAIVTRFWDLGERALHHDESLHSYYSWLYATGSGYIHDPLMHGPFLFHLNALIFLLFGSSDVTTRYGPALFGVLLVGFPYFLRGPRHLGRWGALAASFLFLISPAFLYQSRYIRHDIYTAVGALLLFACVVRYIERPQRRWLITGGATLALLLANHEVIFIIMLAFAVYLWMALLWGRFRALIVPQIVALILAASVTKMVPKVFNSHLPAIPWENPTRSDEITFAKDLVTDPLLISLAIILIGFILVSRAILRRQRDDAAAADTGWMSYLFGQSRPQSVERGLLAVWLDRSSLWLAIAIGAIIWVALYTSLFSNLAGIGSGSAGALFYWLGQQNYQRGHQPWFYYLLLLPQYEFIAVIIGIPACCVAVWRAGRCLIRQVSAPPRLFCQLFLVVWFVIVFAALSWAGEKMPWLVIHIALPLTLLAAALIGEFIERGLLWRRSHATGAIAPERHAWVTPALVGLLLTATASWFFIAAHLTYGDFEPLPNGQWQRVATSYAATHWWLLALPPAAVVGLLAISWLWRGLRATARPFLVSLLIVLSLLQIHGAVRMVYEQGDIPYDMLIYVQTSPDVTRVMDELGTLSEMTTGGLGIDVWYDANTAWPLQWYLRNYTNKHYYGTQLTGPPSDAAVLFVANDEIGNVAPYMKGYTAQEYVLRWWVPEDQTYREFAIAPDVPPGWSAWKTESQPHGLVAVAQSIGSSLATQFTIKGQQRLYRMVMYRDLPAPFGTKETNGSQVTYSNYDFTVYVRNDLVPLLNQIRYGLG